MNPLHRVNLLNRLGNDNGHATITTAGMIVVILSLGGVACSAAANVIQAHQAQNAADLSAVAGAHANIAGESACVVARHVAERNDASIRQCDVQNQDVVITTQVGIAQAKAKAGPL